MDNGRTLSSLLPLPLPQLAVAGTPQPLSRYRTVPSLWLAPSCLESGRVDGEGRGGQVQRRVHESTSGGSRGRFWWSSLHIFLGAARCWAVDPGDHEI